jgi:hypothetical protein
MIFLLLIFVFVVVLLLAIFFVNAVLATIGAFFGLLSAAITNFQTGAPWRGILLVVPAAVIAVYVGPLLWVLANIVWIWVH